MRYSQSSLLMTVRNIQRFMNDNAVALGEVAASQARVRLDTAERLLNQYAQAQATQSLAAAAATQRHLDLRHALLADFVQPIVLIARAEAMAIPELGTIQMPKVPAGDANLAKAANAIAYLAARHADVFMAGGLSDGFVASVHAAGEALLQAAGDRKSSVANQIEATKGLAVQSRAARQRIRVLHAFVRRQIRTQPALYQKWLESRKVATRPTMSGESSVRT